MKPTSTIELEGYQGKREMSLNARMLRQRRLFLTGEINEASANELIQELMYIETEEGDEPVRLYINSGGGEVTGGLMIYDFLQAMKTPVEMFCIGRAASMAAVIFASGKKGHRHILPHGRLMIHEPLIDGGVGGSATSIRNISDSILKTKRILNELLAQSTGKTVEEIDAATAYDHYMDAEESIEFGLCDDISQDIF